MIHFDELISSTRVCVIKEQREWIDQLVIDPSSQENDEWRKENTSFKSEESPESIMRT